MTYQIANDQFSVLFIHALRIVLDTTDLFLLRHSLHCFPDTTLTSSPILLVVLSQSPVLVCLSVGVLGPLLCLYSLPWRIHPVSQPKYCLYSNDFQIGISGPDFSYTSTHILIRQL